MVTRLDLDRQGLRDYLSRFMYKYILTIVFHGLYSNHNLYHDLKDTCREKNTWADLKVLSLWLSIISSLNSLTQKRYIVSEVCLITVLNH